MKKKITTPHNSEAGSAMGLDSSQKMFAELSEDEIDMQEEMIINKTGEDAMLVNEGDDGMVEANKLVQDVHMPNMDQQE